MPNTPDIDISALAEALNEKMDRDMENKTSNIRYVVDVWNSSTNWYRKWSDGFIEQGGTFAYNSTSPNASASITFGTAFSDTNYVVIVYSFNTTSGSGHPVVNGKTTTGVTFVQPASVPYASWYACGF